MLARDGPRCYLCGEEADPADLTLDHRVPLVRGGTNHLANLALAHGACNHEKDDMTDSEYFQKQWPNNKGD